MTDESSDTPTPAASTASTASTGMVHQAHGGAIKPGRRERLLQPTVTDLSESAVRRLYQQLPELTRIASNKPKRPHGKKRGPLKRQHSTVNQIRAIGELRSIVTLDRTLREAQVMRALANTRDEIIEFFEGDRGRADALMSKIAPHWLGV